MLPVAMDSFDEEMEDVSATPPPSEQSSSSTSTNMRPAGFQTTKLGRQTNSSGSPVSRPVTTLVENGHGGGNSGLE